MEIELANITKRFGALVANDHVSLKIRGGRVRALIGENGAGKSTLMNILYGLVQPDSGEIRIDGRPVRFRTPADAIRHRLGMVHQEFMLVPSLTVLENVILGHEPVGAAGWLRLREARARVERIMTDSGLTVPLDQRTGELPVSMQQRVEILKTLYRGAEVLILDEPTAVLTPQEADGLFEVMRKLTAQGKTVIFITHKLREVLAVADDIAVMRQGRVVADQPNGGLSETDIARLMVGRDVLMRLERRRDTLGDVILAVNDLWVLDDQRIPRVRGVSFKVHAGEVVGVAGVAGNGQSELVEALFGLRPIRSGRILLHGHPVDRPKPRILRDEGVAYIPQDRNTVGSIRSQPIWKNVLAGRQWRSPFARHGFLHIDRCRGHAADVIRRFQVKAPDCDTPCGALSGGNLQKLIVGRELAGKPTLLIAEDPTRGIDIAATEFVRQRILEHAQQGGAVLLISADLQETLMLSDRILVMYEGRIVGEVSSERATEEQLGLLMAGSADYRQSAALGEANPT